MRGVILLSYTVLGSEKLNSNPSSVSCGSSI